jgi:hypothetical protein
MLKLFIFLLKQDLMEILLLVNHHHSNNVCSLSVDSRYINVAYHFPQIYQMGGFQFAILQNL